MFRWHAGSDATFAEPSTTAVKHRRPPEDQHENSNDAASFKDGADGDSRNSHKDELIDRVKRNRHHHNEGDQEQPSL